MATPYVTMVCSRCKQETDDFAPHKTLGRQAYCRPCQRAYNAERREVRLAYDRQRQYGISPEAQRVLWESQNGRCAGCRGELAFADAHLDHDHATGRVRGFLCQPCNLTLGFSQESIPRLIALADYVREQTI